MSAAPGDERTPLLRTELTGDDASDADARSDASEIEHLQTCRLLYTSHFLSTWNSRLFEFGAVLFLINIYPRTLLPVSVYALARAASGALISPAIGAYIDRKDRLSVVRLSIVAQRIPVAASCAIFLSMKLLPSLRDSAVASNVFLASLSVLACIEKLASVMNTIAVERDWVVVVAAANEGRLRALNSRMRRIDLFCKLIAPLAIALIDGASTKIAIIVAGSMSILSVVAEYFAIARVYRKVPELQMPRDIQRSDSASREGTWEKVKKTLAGTKIYCQHPAFLPSFALALLYLTVLSFSGQMITYLAALGLQSAFIGVLRGVSALFELSATWLAPLIISRIGSVRAGIWFINWQIGCVAACSVFFWMKLDSRMTIVGTVIPVIASRVGLWGFDLSVQNIVQDEVEAPLRGAFSSQEFALQNIFEMMAFASTIVFYRPQQFQVPATISAGAVGIAGILFAVFVRGRRGHLLHLSRCIDPNGYKNRDHHHWWMGVDRREEDDDDDDERSIGTATARPENESA